MGRLGFGSTSILVTGEECMGQTCDHIRRALGTGEGVGVIGELESLVGLLRLHSWSGIPILGGCACA